MGLVEFLRDCGVTLFKLFIMMLLKWLSRPKILYFLQLQGGYAPLTPLYGRLISSLPDFFSSPVPIPDYCLLSHWSIWFLPTPTLLFVIPYTHITVCNPTDQFGFSLHPHYCLLSHWSIWFLPTPTLLFVIPLINLVSPYTHITVCNPTDQFGFSLHPHYCL